MDFDFDANFFEDDSDFEDGEFDHLAELVAYPSIQRIFITRIDHFTSWRNDEFFD